MACVSSRWGHHLGFLAAFSLYVLEKQGGYRGSKTLAIEMDSTWKQDLLQVQAALQIVLTPEPPGVVA